MPATQASSHAAAASKASTARASSSSSDGEVSDASESSSEGAGVEKKREGGGGGGPRTEAADMRLPFGARSRSATDSSCSTRSVRDVVEEDEEEELDLPSLGFLDDEVRRHSGTAGCQRVHEFSHVEQFASDLSLRRRARARSLSLQPEMRAVYPWADGCMRV